VKVPIEAKMTPHKARRVMGPPEMKDLNHAAVAGRHKRMTAGLDTTDRAAMMKAKTPSGGCDQFQRYLRESAGMDDKKN
jgi:hypothetical protein